MGTDTKTVVTDEMVADARNRLPDRIDFDFIWCCSCGWIGLVSLGNEDCPKCEHVGCLMFCDDDNPEFSL